MLRKSENFWQAGICLKSQVIKLFMTLQRHKNLTFETQCHWKICTNEYIIYNIYMLALISFYWFCRIAYVVCTQLWSWHVYKMQKKYRVDKHITQWYFFRYYSTIPWPFFKYTFLSRVPLSFSMSSLTNENVLILRTLAWAKGIKIIFNPPQRQTW